MSDHEQTTKALVRVPRWVCVLAIALGSAGLIIQAAVDVYQGVNTSMDWPTWLLQAWQMSLPTGFTMAFAAIGGCLLYARRWVVAACLYVLVGCYMAVTASNGMDFVANQTVARTQAELTKQADITSIIALQNETAVQERQTMTQNLWRTYEVARSQPEKDKALVKIQEITRAPVALVQADVQVIQSGSGGILNRWLGWDRVSIQETKALAFPVLVMIGKALGVTLGFAFWPPSTAAADRWRSQLPKSGKFPIGMETERKLTKDDARKDIMRSAEVGANIDSGRELAARWGVTESCASKWLADFRREGLIKRERRGKFMAVRATVPKLDATFPIATSLNGNGRAHA